MICPHCERMELEPDHDRLNRVECYACPLCGFRHYPLYPARIGDEPDDCLKKGANQNMTTLILHECTRCGNMFEGTRGRKFCGDCRKAVELIRQRKIMRERRGVEDRVTMRSEGTHERSLAL